MSSIAGAVKTYTEYLFFHTKKRREIVPLTPQLEEIVARSGIRDGFCFVSTKKSYRVTDFRPSSAC